MPTPSGHTTPLWAATADVPDFPPLGEDATTDVCVIGAGIAGLSTAYLLGRAGRRVLVLDDNRVGGGETGRTTAHLSSALDDRYQRLERLHGPEGARLAAESHMSAIHRIEAIAREEGIDCDFERLDGYLFLGEGDSITLLEREEQAARRAGLAGVTLLERAPVGFWNTGPCLRFPEQGQFHPLKYLAGLARAVVRDGGRIHCGSHVSEIEASDERPEVRTDDGHTVRAQALVVATNSPVNDWVALHTKQAPYRTYVVALRVPRDSVPRALYWDTPDPYHYVRLQREGDDDLLLVGGEDHKTGQGTENEGCFDRLEGWARDRFPMAGALAYRWSGQVMEPVDRMAFIGRDPAGQHNVYVATGDSGHGMTHGTIAGILLTDLITGRDNPWATLYDPSRRTLRAAADFVRENVNVAAQYADYVTPGEVDSADEIQPGHGAVLRRGARKIAVYRAEDGTLHERSAVCTHLYCIVHWNDVERSWDCPCHGSRFAPTGEVLNGPAAAPLDPAEE
ncbi:MAG TPA: FAD-dependent oxidoreductase [Gemmatimonadaceae bacterium]|jgi:glycine/D-amino acid oxidase-like deaminating enzyme/nitrite reductase/ring-hydroxylating ferredoxin subunit